MADFTGFYFNNIHSSTYHLIRTSEGGGRYVEELFPSFDDRVVEMIGGNGKLYDNTHYKEKEFTISVAFDNITEQDFRNMRAWLEPNKIQDFRFDERPYKAYWAKLKNTPKFEYVCFMEENDNFYGQQRVYKGTAELNFIAYDPFGYCCDSTTKMTDEGLEELSNKINWQCLDSYSLITLKDNNMIEWGKESGLRNRDGLKKINLFSNKDNEEKTILSADLYNPGDFDADFELYIFPKTDYEEKDHLIQIKIYNGETITSFLTFLAKDFTENDSALLTTKNHSLKKIRIVKKDTKLDKTAELRYDLIKEKSLEWLKVPRGESRIEIDFGKKIDNPIVQIKYNYKYY